MCYLKNLRLLFRETEKKLFKNLEFKYIFQGESNLKH